MRILGHANIVLGAAHGGSTIFASRRVTSAAVLTISHDSVLAHALVHVSFAKALGRHVDLNNLIEDQLANACLRLSVSQLLVTVAGQLTEDRSRPQFQVDLVHFLRQR